MDVISVFPSDGRITALDLVVLTDDAGVLPPYDAVVLAGRRLSHELSEVLRSLAGLAGSIDAARMRRMNHAVDGEGRLPAAVAAEFLALSEGR